MLMSGFANFKINGAASFPAAVHGVTFDFSHFWEKFFLPKYTPREV